jgi:hypothetical protein
MTLTEGARVATKEHIRRSGHVMLLTKDRRALTGEMGALG